MKLIIADTFTRALDRLAPDEQAAAKLTSFDLQVNPQAPGLNYEPLKRPKDPNFRSCRVSRDIRIILHERGDTRMLCYVDHHDAAYQWAERRRIDVHPETGAAQIVEVVEQEIIRPVYRDVVQDPPLFARYEAGYLQALGVPPEWVEAVRHVGQEAFESLIGRLPEEAMERLMELALGNPVPVPVAVIGVNPFEHPDARRRFRVVENHNELHQALEFPWAKWMVFLHPAQNALVEKRFNGPALVTGAAGTGKSVVALHRTAALARKDGGRVLLTSYSRTLAARLGANLDMLLGATSAERRRVHVASLHSVAREAWVSRMHADLRVVRSQEFVALLEQAIAASGVREYSTAFLKAEWEAIVDPFGLRSFDGYRAASRARRGTPLGARQKQAVWPVFDELWRLLDEAGQVTWNSLCYEAARMIDVSGERPFDHVIVDESQDLGPAELVFARSMAEAGQDDLFFCGDTGQRIFKARFSWAFVGIDVRGRSSRLKLNYRTTGAIQQFSDKLLPKGADEDQVRDALSLLQGPSPDCIGNDDSSAESGRLAEWLRHMTAEGLSPGEIAVFARTEALLRQRVKPALDRCGIPYEDLSDDAALPEGGVSIGTMHRAKGLEFRAVAVVGCDAANLPLASVLNGISDPGDREAFVEQERQLLYVACSRARERMLVSWAGRPSEFLSNSFAATAGT